MIDDPLLPAAEHLAGPDASDVLRPAVDASGGELVSCRVSHVQYRPGSDLVVRFRCRVRRDGAEHDDTLLAGTSARRPFEGTVPVEAETRDGSPLSVSVWRWPFDPVLGELCTMVTPRSAGERLHDLVGPEPDLRVVAYRPTERAVVRAVGRGRDIYVKIVPPASTDALIRRHDTLLGAGLPVPRVLAAGDGWIAMSALTGTTLRDRLKSPRAGLPSPACVRDLLRALADVELDDARPVRSRLDDAPHHAAMLASVVPAARPRIDEAIARLAEVVPTRRVVATVHGDLHEAQLVADDATVNGILDIDDAGTGDPLDDVGTLLAHLRFRSLTSGNDQRVDDYAAAIRAAVAADHDPRSIDAHVAAVLVGLATGPFRIQQAGWEATTAHTLDLVEDHLAAAEHADLHCTA